MGFFSSLIGGSNPTLSSDIKQFGQVGGFATGLGEKNIGQSSKFYSDILSGDPTKQATALAPEIAGIQGQKQQQLKATAEFGNRSGGTNSANQMASDNARSSINSMISSLLGNSAGALSSSGSSLIGTGLGAYNNQVNASQLQMQNWQQGILGGAITGAAGIGLGAAGKGAGVGGMFGL